MNTFTKKGDEANSYRERHIDKKYKFIEYQIKWIQK